MIPLSELAEQEYRRRLQRARQVVGAGQMSAAAADQQLYPWLAIACLCGAALPEIEPLLADFVLIWGRPLDEAERRTILADDICARQRRLAVLAKARDQALERAACPDTTDRARGLQRLAAALGAPAQLHHTAQKEAA